ncbi:hypothetical protein AI2609V1_2266 [Citrobacter freundii]|nr:hypothetical protein AI2609V1_2266 [Citrobacter freundii]CAH3602840.1 hypothetical protein AI2609V1_2266 [Citrobacter freundii]
MRTLFNQVKSDINNIAFTWNLFDTIGKQRGGALSNGPSEFARCSGICTPAEQRFFIQIILLFFSTVRSLGC